MVFLRGEKGWRLSRWVMTLPLLCLTASLHVDLTRGTGECHADNTCPAGLCCSKDGYCGPGDDYCGFGCKGGLCNNASSRSPSDSIVGACISDTCAPGLCCSKDGFCGPDDSYCGFGCRSGPCHSSPGSKGLSTGATAEYVIATVVGLGGIMWTIVFVARKITQRNRPGTMSSLFSRWFSPRILSFSRRQVIPSDLNRVKVNDFWVDQVKVNDSLYELYKPDTIKIQIVFFHGLQLEDCADAHLSAWQGGDGCTIWPQTWLVEEIPGAHVLSISYNGGLKNSSCDMYNIRENLLNDLLQDNLGQVDHCPVVLVGHSIGGLVIKELCCHAHNRLHSSYEFEKVKLEKFLKNIGGIFYYSTPLNGTFTEVAEILAKKGSSRTLLTYFETLSKKPARLNAELDRIRSVNYKDWLFAGLGEGLPTNLGSHKLVVVPEGSARLPVFHVVPDADHFSVCRPKSKKLMSFYMLREFISRVASKATDAENIKPANRSLA